MTRARDMLYLSQFQKKKRRFQPSAFLVEVAGGDPAVRATLPLPPKFTPPADEALELPSLSFSEACPLR